MNTSDRSIAILDFAIRRRFAFVDLWPDRAVIEKVNSEEINKIALPAFDKVMNIFIEHANQEELNLIPGHSYFLAKDVNSLKIRLQHEVIPLLKEYLAEGHLSSFRDEVLFIIDYLNEVVS
jgi:5-methylcytosine-specific restriction protein B